MSEKKAAAVSVTGLRKRFKAAGDTYAIDGLGFEIGAGELLVLLGPSGCGKTTTLRCLAGLETADEGEISLGGRVVFGTAPRVNVPPESRSIGMVFQSYALWPHMTIRRNIGYPLKARKRKDLLRTGAVEQVAAMIECDSLLDRYPSQLSGGQQQRVALARGLVAQPDLVLFDEPLSNLDARLRDVVRGELHRLHRQLGFTGVYVTHDQSEAMALGDRVAVMRAGCIEQLDVPAEIFERPATEFVAEFVGMSNQLLIDAHDEATWIGGHPLHGIRLVVAGGREQVSLRLRPDALELFQAGSYPRPGTRGLAQPCWTPRTPARPAIVLAIGETTIRANISIDDRSRWIDGLQSGAAVRFGFRIGAASNLFDPTTGVRCPAEAVAVRSFEDVSS